MSDDELRRACEEWIDRFCPLLPATRDVAIDALIRRTKQQRAAGVANERTEHRKHFAMRLQLDHSYPQQFSKSEIIYALDRTEEELDEQRAKELKP